MIRIQSKTGVVDPKLVSADQAAAAADRAGARRNAQVEGGQEGVRLHLLPAVHPARVRRDLALRRRLRDREHALDHDRAADARVRDAAHARRLTPPGALVGRDRGLRDRPGRLGDRALPRPRAGEAAEQAVRHLRDRPAAGPDRLRDAHRDRLAARGHARHAGRQHPSGATRDPRAADRRSARRLRAAGLALRQVRPRHRAGVLVDRDRAGLARRARKRHRDRPAPADARRRRAAALLRRLDERGPGRAAARRGARRAGPRRSAARPGSSRATTRPGTRRGPPRRPRR